MRILHLLYYPLWGSGSGTYARELTATLATQKGNQVAIVAPEQRTVKNVKIYPVKLPFNVAATGHPEFKKTKLYHELSPEEFTQIYDTFFKASVHAVKQFQPDIIHVHHIFYLTWIAKYIKNVYHINFIVTAHGTGLLSTTKNRKMFQKQTTDALKEAKRVTAVSGDTRKWVRELHGDDFAHKMRTIPGGIHVEDFPPTKKIRTINAKYRLRGKRVVFFSGKLTPLKGVDYLVKAAEKINGHVFIAGGGSEERHLKQIAKDRRLRNVHFLGYMGKNKRKAFHEFYYRADVFVAPSVWDEPLGLVILEAMVTCTPVVVTRKGGIPLAVKDGVNGLFVRPRNSSDIAEKVNRILQDPILKKRLGVNARKTVLEKFTWRKIAKKFMRIYHDSLNGNGKRKNRNGKKRVPLVHY